MTSNTDLKQQFISLRAKGYSLEKIAKQIGKCRQTLSNWNSDLQEEIANAKAIELEALFEECLLTKEHRIKDLSKLLSRINQELEKRDLSMLSDDKLVDIKIKINSQLKEEFIETKIVSENEINSQKRRRSLIL
jgi:transcriptional regulator with XRE-family HTH domain